MIANNVLKYQKNQLLHEDFRREEKFKVASDRNFGIVFAIVFSLIGFWSLWRGGHHWMAWLIAGAIFGLLAALIPRSLAHLNLIWMKVGLILFRIVSPVTLAFLFFFCMAPIGLILRFMKKDLLNLKADAQVHTYWITRDPPGPEPETLKNQY